MRPFPSSRLLVAFACLAAFAGCAPSPEPAPRNIVLMIGDGMGFSQIAFARALLLERGERWAFETMPVTGIVSTWSDSNVTTDSGAAATAMASGLKTGNQSIGMDAEGQPANSMPATAIEVGWRVGYVTTTAITHATPASFYAHVANRYDDVADIAVQLLDHPARIAAGGGRGAFLPEAEGGWRSDGQDLIAAAVDRGWTIWESSSDLDRAPGERALGLFADNHFPFRLDDLRVPAEERAPSLKRLAEIALASLSGGDEPFFLLIEGGRIDHASHSFDAPATAYEVQDFDEAVRAVMAFQQQNPDTLVLVTADHATGGLAINDYADWDALERQRASVEWMGEQIRKAGAGAEMVREMTGYEDISEADLDPVRQEENKYEAWRHLARLLSDRNGISWIPRVGPDTSGHTGEDVPIYAIGPGAERYQGVIDNTEIATRLFELAGLRPASD